MPNNITNIGFSDYSADQADIERRRAYAQALQQQGMQPMGETQMAGGWAIPNSPTQGLAKMLQAYSGRKGEEQATEQQKALGERYQSDYQRMVAKGLRELQGSPAQENPGSELSPGWQTPAQAADPMAALATFGSHPQGAALAPLAMQQIQLQQRQKMLADILRGGGASQQGSSTAPAPQGSGFGAGIPPQIMALMTSGDAELAALGKSLLEANKGIAQRAGAPVVNPFTGAVIAQPTPAVPPGVALQVGPGGPAAYPVPGAIPAMAGVTASQAGAGEAGKAPYQLETLNTEGAPSLMTREQAIQAATGKPMPQPGMPPQGQQPMGTTAAPRPGTPDYEAYKQVASGSVPTAYVQQGKTPGLRLQDQGAGAEQREFGKSLGEYTTKVQTEAANAAVGNRFLDNMQHEAQNIRLGKLAPAQSSLIQWAQAAGLPVSDEAKKTAGSVQALSSMAIKMAGAATRASDAQPSQLQFLKTLESMPTAERSSDGFQKITAYLRDLNNYSIAKQQYLQQWRQGHNGTAEGFETEWPKTANELPFIWNQQKTQAGSGGLSAQEQSELQALRTRFGR